MRDMKLVLTFLLVAVATAIMAQPPKDCKKQGGMEKERLEKVYATLDNLSAEQKEQIKGVFDKYKPEKKALREEMKAKQAEIRKEMQPRMEAIRDKQNSDLAKVLTEDQMQQLLALQELLERQ